MRGALNSQDVDWIPKMSKVYIKLFSQANDQVPLDVSSLAKYSSWQNSQYWEKMVELSSFL